MVEPTVVPAQAGTMDGAVYPFAKIARLPGSAPAVAGATDGPWG